MGNTQVERRIGARVGQQALSVEVDGERVTAFAGETVAAMLLALGHPAFRRTEKGAPRGVFCGMGICFDCLVTVDGVENVRACMTTVEEGMVIETGGRHHG
jgi:predicted molibdopterin-dependent oxidoreductase YjgC